jgi:small subunit ribosomal protein S20
MPNTKSAERRARNSARKHDRNRAAKSRLGTLEQKYNTLVGAGKRDEAIAAFRLVSSAFDKAAKTGVLPKARANRKKSRLAVRLNKLK